MLKRILLTVGSIVTGINFGLIAGFSPVYLLILLVLFPDDPLNETSMIVLNLLTAAATGVGTYIYSYRKKREHEEPNRYLMTLAISFIAGALITAVLLFVYLGDPNSGLGNRLL